MQKLVVILAAFLVLRSAMPAVALTTPPLIYQALVEFDGAPANGVFDIVLDVYDQASGGTKLTTANTLNGQPIEDGLLATELLVPEDLFNGSPLWVEVSIRASGQTSYTVLDGRQQIGSAGNAFYAANGPNQPEPAQDISGLASPSLVVRLESIFDTISRDLSPFVSASTTRNVSGVPDGPIQVGPESGFLVNTLSPYDPATHAAWRSGGLDRVNLRYTISSQLEAGTAFLELFDGSVLSYTLIPDENGVLTESMQILFPPELWSYTGVSSPSPALPTLNPGPTTMTLAGVPVPGAVVVGVPTPQRFPTAPPVPGVATTVGPTDYGLFTIDVNPAAIDFIFNALTAGPLEAVTIESAGGVSLMPRADSAPTVINFVSTSDGGFKAQIQYATQRPR